MKNLDFMNDGKRIYFNDAQNRLAGEVSYFALPEYNALVCERVFVAPELRGQGVAEKLMLAFINYVKEQQQQIYPLCPYAKRFFAKYPEYNSLNIQHDLTESKIRDMQNEKEQQ
ncbi:hypothetical protein IV79_GL000083 [Pediococcus claussenii]|nr:hypothetical protein IV79_GL000083 [Pediococcus claussenii]